MLSVFGFMIAAILQRIRYAAGHPDEYVPETQIIYIVYAFCYLPPLTRSAGAFPLMKAAIFYLPLRYSRRKCATYTSRLIRP